MKINNFFKMSLLIAVPVASSFSAFAAINIIDNGKGNLDIYLAAPNATKDEGNV